MINKICAGEIPQETRVFWGIFPAQILLIVQTTAIRHNIFYFSSFSVSSCVLFCSLSVYIHKWRTTRTAKIMQFYQNNKYTINLPWEKGSGTSWSSSQEHLPKYQIPSYRKDLSWPHFVNEPRVPEKQQVKDQQSSILLLVFVGCLTIPSSNWGHQPRHDNSIPYMGIW